MTQFPEPPKGDYAPINIDSTDQPLPARLNPNTRYIHFKTIAQGGKAIIQSCKDLHLGRTVCCKKLRPEFTKDPLEQQRLIREARVSAMLQHPNTVPIYELGKDIRGNLYFTMKLVHGYTLREILNYRERYDLRQLLDVVRQVAYALEFAHSHRVIHRDIKPENILVGPFGEVLLLDWGLAKVWHKDSYRTSSPPTLNATAMLDKVSNLTDQVGLQGTVSYMSPEQLMQDPAIDYRSDIFSLGVILYEILSGRTPHVAETVREMRDKILQDSPTPPSTYVCGSIPKLLEELVMQCLEKEPAKRIHDCGVMVRLLQEDWH